MSLKKFILKVVTSIAFCTFFIVESQQISSTYAATSLNFYNLTTGNAESYTGKQVIYTYNGRTLKMTYPGIIVNGTALADCMELFAEELGLQVNIEGENITISDGVSVMNLILGSNKVTFNGETRTTSIVPVKLFFEDSIKYYVPSRFVAEAFGFNYVWVSSTSTVKITKTLNLEIDGKTVDYNGSFYTATYAGETIPSILPMIYHNGTIYAPAATIFEAAGCTYEENGTTMLMTKGELSLKAELNNKNAYLNGKKYIMGVTPVQITDQNTGVSLRYIPFEFVTDMLGFEFLYDEGERCYTLYETENTGKITDALSFPDNFISKEQTTTTIDTQNRTYYFNWEEDITAEKIPEYNYLTKVCVYALENNIEVLELYGIQKESLEAFWDNGIFVLELSSVRTNISDQFYSFYNDPNSRLVYTLLTVLENNTKLFVMPNTEIKWHIIETADCVQVYFMPPELSEHDLFASTTVSAYPDDKLIIPLPDTVADIQIQDKDNYLEKNFQITFSGNYENFFIDNLIINPYYLVKDYDIVYQPITDTTTITFYTRSVCAYNYVLQDGYLEVSVGRPKEFYSKIIILDAGHGGTDPGASKGGYNEKDINFTILNTYTKKLFEDSDIKVYFTRETDVLIDLYDRAAFASEVGADMFLSLHMNANNSSSVSGTEIFYSSYNNAVTENGLYSSRLGKTLAENISLMMGTKNRGVSNSEFVVVKYNTVPAVLIELGFMTNKAELAKLTNPEYQIKAAMAIYFSVFEIFELFPTGR